MFTIFFLVALHCSSIISADLRIFSYTKHLGAVSVMKSELMLRPHDLMIRRTMNGRSKVF